MIVHDVQQGSAEWLDVRCGKPTASEFDKIVTSLGKVSDQADGYMRRLFAERITGRPTMGFMSGWMERGTELEPEAAEFMDTIASINGETVSTVGFVTTDDGKIGASPDRLVGGHGLIEIKCPKADTHVGYMQIFGTSQSVAKKYKVQVQGQLWIAERTWCDVVSYHPDFDPVVERVERDEKFIDTLRKCVRAFSDTLESAVVEARSRGWVKSPQSAIAYDMDAAQ